MKKLKLSLSSLEGVELLPREQLKKISGGGSGNDGGGCPHCNCECFDMPGSWSGTYCSQAEEFADIHAYCRYGGYCGCS